MSGSSSDTVGKELTLLQELSVYRASCRETEPRDCPFRERGYVCVDFLKDTSGAPKLCEISFGFARCGRVRRLVG